MSPFRSQPQSFEAPIAASDDVRDAVGQMVRQFADPMAFLRELVQNGIDAGATSLDVSLDWEAPADGARGTLHATVTDDGSGMTQDVIERSLLVLFRSTKDRDPTKIGKFGVGFFSVFAPAPREVRVDTGTDASREALRLRLRPDFTYELETAAPRRGTAVTLLLDRSEAEARAFADEAIEALARWCPHVAVSLTFEARGMGDADRKARIDRPLSLEGDAQITHRAGPITWCLAASVAPRAAFYNRGILLHELTSSLVAGVHLKVDSPELRHTLSRDDVRRDAAFQSVITRARSLASGPLSDALRSSLRALAESVATARHQGAVHPRAAELVSLLDVARKAPFSHDADTLPWPLVAPTVIDGAARAWSTFDVNGWFRSDRAYFAVDRTPIALTLAGRGVAVVDLGVAGDARVHELSSLLSQCFGPAAVDVASRFCLPRAQRVGALAGDARQLVMRVGALLGAADLGGAALGELVGAGRDRAWIALRDRADFDRDSLVIDVEDEAPFALARDRIVVLNASHPAVRAALVAAKRDVSVAAVTLARLVLLSGGRLDEERDHELLSRAAVAET